MRLIPLTLFKKISQNQTLDLLVHINVVKSEFQTVFDLFPFEKVLTRC